MSQPQVPPRPVRSQAPPTIPPRPSRRGDHSESPSRDQFPRSPLNDSPFAASTPREGSDLQRVASINASRSGLHDAPVRPPSRSLPSIGQEGMEYADLEMAVEDLKDGTQDPQHTRRVSNDLPLHAPKPSLGQSDANARISAVTQPGQNGTSKRLSTADDSDSSGRDLKAKPSFGARPSSSSSYDRPASSQLEEQGIPHIGLHVPMYPNAGDVQAPSPSPFAGNGTPQSGLDKPHHHGRSRSGRENFQPPPGSYGLHGHAGHEPADAFEKAWLQKHPEAMAPENGLYSPAIMERKEWAMSSDDLNKIVRDSAKGAGFGTSAKQVAMPNEQIGYMASEEYASRMSTPKLSSRPATSNQADHPLRKASFPGQVTAAAGQTTTNTDADGPVIHIDAPVRREGKVGSKMIDGQVDLGPEGGNSEKRGGWIDENGHGIPILASDEIEPGNEHLQPAIPPVSERRSSQAGLELDYNDHTPNTSRPSSRPSSIHGGFTSHLHRFTSRGDEEGVHTPLADVQEYEPLFPEEEDNDVEMRPVSHAERFKGRPDMRQRFPSQDVWEDTPSFSQLQAEVETPEPQKEVVAEPPAKSSSTPTFETPEAEAARRGEVSEADKRKLIPAEERLAKSHFRPHIKQEMDMGRPSLRNRFPSHDIWEDSPDSHHITTTVGEDLDPADDEGLKAGAVVYTTSRLNQDLDKTGTGRDGATDGAPAVVPDQPVVPPRPSHPKHIQKAQEGARSPPESDVSPQAELQRVTSAGSATSEKSKPMVPPRPTKLTQRKSQDAIPKDGASDAPTIAPTTTIAAAAAAPITRDVTSPPIPTKAKPAVPARPAAGKIAALQAGFMSDLNKKLGLGPQAAAKPEQETEKEEDKAPLADARKGRARGPQRRKPAASPGAGVGAGAVDTAGGNEAAGSEAGAQQQRAKLSVVAPVMIWEISGGRLSVPHAEATAARSEDASGALGSSPLSASQEAEKSAAPTDSSTGAEKAEDVSTFDSKDIIEGGPSETYKEIGPTGNPEGTLQPPPALEAKTTVPSQTAQTTAPAPVDHDAPLAVGTDTAGEKVVAPMGTNATGEKAGAPSATREAEKSTITTEGRPAAEAAQSEKTGEAGDLGHESVPPSSSVVPSSSGAPASSGTGLSEDKSVATTLGTGIGSEAANGGGQSMSGTFDGRTEPVQLEKTGSATPPTALQTDEMEEGEDV